MSWSPLCSWCACCHPHGIWNKGRRLVRSVGIFLPCVNCEATVLDLDLNRRRVSTLLCSGESEWLLQSGIGVTARQNRGEGNAGQNRGGGRAKSQNFWSSAFCFDIKCYINASIQITKNQEKESFSFPQNIMACKGYRAEQERRPSKKPELQLFVWTVCLSKVKVKVKVK